VAAEIVDDDDVARLERRQQNLFDISLEEVAVDGAIDDARGVETVGAKRRQEGQRLPRRARPWVRVMLVLAQVSSMKTSRAGSSRP
jgi:hypothetical protein